MTIDLTAEAMCVDPYPALAELRRSDPVHWSSAHRSWILTRYADVRDALKDTRLSTELHEDLLDRVPESHPLHRYSQRWMLFKDAPDHTRLQSLVAPAFTPGVINQLQQSVEAIVADLAEGLATLSQYPSLESAVEELIRFDGPGRFLVRHVKEDFEIDDNQFRQGPCVSKSVWRQSGSGDVYPARHPQAYPRIQSPRRLRHGGAFLFGCKSGPP